MSTPLNRLAPGGARTPLGGGRGPALAPAPSKGQKPKRRGWLWALLLPLLLLGLTYLSGRMVEPIRAVLAKVPVAGPALFAKPVWPILWNKPATPEAAAPTPQTGVTPGTTPSTPPTADTGLQRQIDEAAARLVAAEAKETDLADREAAVQLLQEALAKEQADLAAKLAAAEALTQKLQGQLRSEQDRVEIVREMSRTSQTQFFGALTDDEALAILKYMAADEVADILGKLDPFRAARLFQRLPQVAPASQR
jgi:flagellar motility protein MotE (MotC chaperone)